MTFSPEWCTAPPIIELASEAELRDYQRKFERSLGTLAASSTAKRADDAVRISQQCKVEGTEFNRQRTFVYILGGLPVALLCTTKSMLQKDLFIADIATDPRVRNGSDVIIGWAMRESKVTKARLSAENEDAAASYRAIGFETKAGDNLMMYLDCSQSDQWEVVDGRPYRVKYKSHQDGYGFASAAEAPNWAGEWDGKRIELRRSPG